MIGDAAAVDLLLELCRVPSVSTDEAAAVELLGHIDTVAGFIPPRVEDGALHGRGAVDAKGPLAAFLVAAARVAPVDGTRVVVIGAVEEEAPSSRGARFVADRYAPRVAVIGEPSGIGAVTLGYKGRVGVRLHAERARSHSAGESRSVGSDAVEFWTRVEAYCRQFNRDRPIFDRVDPHLSSFNTVSDGFQDRVDLHGSFRLPIDFPLDGLERALGAFAGDWATCELHDVTPGFRANKRNALVRAFLTAIRAHGLEPRFTLKTGTSDMNIVGPAWGCPIVAYGPGDSRLDHAPDERVTVREYLQGIEILTRVLERLVARP